MKTAKPDFFYGDRDKVDDWLNQMALYFHLHLITVNKTMYAATYLRGKA